MDITLSFILSFPILILKQKLFSQHKITRTIQGESIKFRRSSCVKLSFSNNKIREQYISFAMDQEKGFQFPEC